MHHNEVSYYLLLLTIIIAIIIAIRYFLVTHMNEVLLQEREQQHRQSERLRHISTRLTAILELDGLLEQTVQLAISELGFDAAMLLLIEEHTRPLNSQSRLLIHVAAAHPTNITHQRWQGEYILYQSILQKKPIEEQWERHDIPPEIRSWQQKQHISAMLFVPLTYQEKMLGSLGIARRDAHPLSEHDLSVVKAYAEQVGIVIEHVQLYQEAREHEAFARAMANIATSLNSAVMEKAEISNLICREGAHALRADYVMLYITNKNGQLVPLVASFGEPESSLAHEWHALRLTNDETQALYSLQPTLLHITELAAEAKTPSLQRPTSMTSEKTPSLSADISFHDLHPLLQEKLAQHFVQTIILAPLIAGGDPIGMLIFARSLPPGTHDKRPLNTADLPYAQDFVEQAAVAFSNAQLYQHLRTAHQRLQELDQLKDQFMITASHELRTPLTAIQGYIELMVEYGERLPLDQQREFLLKAQRGCDELVVLLGNIMDASRLEVEAGIKPALSRPVNIQEMIASVLVLIGPQVAQEQREVSVNIAEHLSVMADPLRLRQVLMNLSINALKYSYAQSPLSFSAHSTATDDTTVTISITDKGKGITPENQTRLFQRFVRLESDINSPIRGSGLGLYISRRLIEAMGGTIWIESSGIPGEGSTFHIQLPAADQQPS